MIPGHPGPLLSALLDGELEPSVAARVRAHVGACGACAAELRAVSEARSAVRSLPRLDPPAGLFRVRRARVRAAVAAVAASVAAAAAVVVLAEPHPAPVRPKVAEFVDAHVATASLTGDPVSELVRAGIPTGTDR